jgi:replication fork protection complex subunit Tof1/Swi1
MLVSKLPPKVTCANLWSTSLIQDLIEKALCQKIRRAIERDVERLLMTHTKQFFYLVAWFLKAERVRRTKSKSTALDDDTDSFSLVAAVLNQEMLILLNRKMMEWYDLKSWRELQAGMQCLTQIVCLTSFSKIYILTLI